jgi:hypothetical protein
LLPEKFWKPNEQNVRGGIELGFMSTTADREVAVRYAKSDDKPSVVFEIQMGMVDRGAPLKWCSQFPGEEEILFAPLTGLEVVGTPVVENSAMIVELRANCNLHDLTIEQILDKMRKVGTIYIDIDTSDWLCCNRSADPNYRIIFVFHCLQTHFDLLDIVRTDISLLGFPQASFKALDDHEKRYEKQDGAWFNITSNYLDATKDVLRCKLEASEYVLLDAASSAANLKMSLTILLDPKDAMALQYGVTILVKNKHLLEKYTPQLQTVCKSSCPPKDLSLDFKNKGPGKGLDGM